MPPSEAYPKALKSIGDHLRKRRLDLKVFQKDLAKLIGVDECTVTNWEKGRSCPAIRFKPNILKFLGYDPIQQEIKSPGQQIRQIRRVRGLSIRKLALKLGIDPATLSRWEKNGQVTIKRHRSIFVDLLAQRNT